MPSPLSDHLNQPGVVREKQKWGMTLTPPQMREEASEARSPDRSTKNRVECPTPARWNGAGLFAHLMRARSEDPQNPRRIRFETARLTSKLR